MGIISDFVKKKEYLICIDSDGCAMDTMDIKHIQCFGPCMVTKWSLEPWQQEILNRWNEINLYTMTRGINRFKALAMALKEINETWCPIEDWSVFLEWSKKADYLSEEAVKEQFKRSGKEIFKMAREWSEEVNVSIDLLEGDFKKPFPGVLEGLIKAHSKADIAIVSSANAQAVKEEWETHGLMDYVDLALTQETGSKASCIRMMLEKGYEKPQVLMIGDAPGDQEAADKNGVSFYPILVRKEEESWNRFTSEILSVFLEGNYQGECRKRMIEAFEENLN